MDEITLRMIERLTGVIIGGVSIFLGFQLFKAIPHLANGEGKFTFPGGSVHLVRTGPGVFFALFGCAIVYWSFAHPIEVKKPDTNEMAQMDSTKQKIFHGLAGEDMAKIQIWIQNLNRIETTMNADRRSITEEDASITIAQVKLFLIRQMLGDPFDPEFEEFSNKIRITPSQSFSAKWQKWADIYNRK